MTEESPQQIEAPVADASAVTETAVASDEKSVDDTAPLTLKEAIESGKQVVQTAKQGVLRPLYRFGRRTIRNAQIATEAFFDGALGEKKK